MKRVLLIDDDPVLVRIYQQGLTKYDLAVETAADGLSAISSLRKSRPDVAVLDLMMPKFNGVDVLRFIRANADLANLPVVVLSNSYMNELGQEASALGTQRILLKVNCSPGKLAGIIQDVLAGKPGPAEPLQFLIPATNSEAAPPPPVQLSKPPARSGPLRGLTGSPESRVGQSVESDFKASARRDLTQNAPRTSAMLHKLCRSFTAARTEPERLLRLHELYHKVHFLCAAASLAESYFLAQMANALEALLFELVAKPSFLTSSVVRTIVSTIDFLVLLFSRVQDRLVSVRVGGLTLVADDDPLSTRLMVAALSKAGLEARSTQDPLVALQWVEQHQFALFLLDIEMPNMDGFELGRRLRAMAAYENTPIIFVTSHTDFETRTKSLFHGGDDLIAKPIFPLELAVKAVAHLLRKQLP
jgi:CheY-like chemotaxis protein